VPNRAAGVLVGLVLPLVFMIPDTARERHWALAFGPGCRFPRELTGGGLP